MEMTRDIYSDIEKRTQGDIYIGIVGPVRTGKSTFVKRFMDSIVLPNMASDFVRERAIDELPQSAAGRTIMTTEPKFIPEEAVQISLAENSRLNVRLIDCVGYIVPSSLGYIEGEQPRMVKTPWFENEIPFNMAAEIGTRKVISEHSTIGLVITTDGSISDIPRYEYEEAEERVIDELRAINKPFVVLLNCIYPEAESARQLSLELSQRYQVPVVPVNCLELNETEIKEILKQVLFEFPIKELMLSLPSWFLSLESEDSLKRELYDCVQGQSKSLSCMRAAEDFCKKLCELDCIDEAAVSDIDLGSGCAKIEIKIPSSLFYFVLSNTTGVQIGTEQDLVNAFKSMVEIKKRYEQLETALREVEATGYGIVMPTIDELSLEEPEIVKQGGKYGVRLRASAPSIHMLKADIMTEVAPIVGSESQSEDLIKYLLQEFQENPVKIWESNIFGKSLHELVNEGLRSKLMHMPTEARIKLQETLQRVINEGCSGLICIIL